MTIFLVQLDFGYATVVAAVEFRLCSSQIQIKCSKMEVEKKKHGKRFHVDKNRIYFMKWKYHFSSTTLRSSSENASTEQKRKWTEWMECVRPWIGGEKGESHRRSHHITNWMYCCTNKYVRISLTRWLMRMHTSCKQQTSATKQQIINLIFDAQPKHIIIYFLPHFFNGFFFFYPCWTSDTV